MRFVGYVVASVVPVTLAFILTGLLMNETFGEMKSFLKRSLPLMGIAYVTVLILYTITFEMTRSTK